MSSSRRPKKRSNLTLPVQPKSRHESAPSTKEVGGAAASRRELTDSIVGVTSLMDGSTNTLTNNHFAAFDDANADDQHHYQYDIDFDLKALRDAMKNEEFLEESGYQSVIARSQHSFYGTGWLVADTLSVTSEGGSLSGDDWDGYIQVAGQNVKIKDLSETLALRYAFLSGVKTKDGYPVLTFPDSRVQVSNPQYHSLVTYLLQVPTLEETHKGYVIIADRRLDKWSSVRMLLLYLSNYFPASVRVVFLLKPEGVLQRALEVGYRSIADSCQFKVVLCQTPQEIGQFIGADCLTLDVGGHLRYNHLEWVQHRMELERLKASAGVIAASLGEFGRCLRDTELPNDADTTKHILDSQTAERDAIKEDFHIVVRKGMALLKNVRQHDRTPHHEQLSPTRLHNVTAIERMLIQLEETEKSFDSFWRRHEKRLEQCLELRRFEEDFRKLQANFAHHMVHLEEHREVGDSPEKASALIEKHKEYMYEAKEDLQTSASLKQTGDELIAAQDPELSGSVAPKCDELSRMAEALDSALNRRLQVLNLSKEMHQQIYDANAWCKAGVELLSSDGDDAKEDDSVAAKSDVKRLDELLQQGAQLHLAVFERQPPELHRLMLLTTTDTSTLLQQVSERINDVRRMCEARRNVLVKAAEKPRHSASSSPVKHAKKRATVKVVQRQESETFFPRDSRTSPTTPTHEQQAEQMLLVSPSRTTGATDSANGAPVSPTEGGVVAAKRLSQKMSAYVTQELLATERAYVRELQSVVEHYMAPFDLHSPASSNAPAAVCAHPLIPDALRHNKTRIFGNLDQLQLFHANVFAEELSRTEGRVEAVARCFLARTVDFHRLYTAYCQHKADSDAFMRATPPHQHAVYFADCQRNAGHRLPLGAYLLKPIQRITKYQLLLRELKKHTAEEDGDETVTAVVEAALSSMLSLLEQLNCSLHPPPTIRAYPSDVAGLGRLLLHGRFNVWVSTVSKKSVAAGVAGGRLKRMAKAQQRHLFLYPRTLLVCKERNGSGGGASHSQPGTPTTATNEHYEFKCQLAVSDAEWLSARAVEPEVRGSIPAGGGGVTGGRLKRMAKAQQRHLFLYSRKLLVCKKRNGSGGGGASHSQPGTPTTATNEHYEFKCQLATSSLRVADHSAAPSSSTAKGDTGGGQQKQAKFDAWNDDRPELIYTLQSLDGRKDEWLYRLAAFASTSTMDAAANESRDHLRSTASAGCVADHRRSAPSASRPQSWASTISSASTDSSSSTSLLPAAARAAAEASAGANEEHDRSASDTNNNPSSPSTISPVGDSPPPSQSTMTARSENDGVSSAATTLNHQQDRPSNARVSSDNDNNQTTAPVSSIAGVLSATAATDFPASVCRSSNGLSLNRDDLSVDIDTLVVDSSFRRDSTNTDAGVKTKAL